MPEQWFREWRFSEWGAAMEQSLRWVASDGSVVQVAADYLGHVTQDAFMPSSWERARLIDSSGRGSAWFIPRSGPDWVLRHYLRGGLIARVARDTYVFTSERAVRSFHEFDLTQVLLAKGLPVPNPVAARYKRIRKCFYRAQIIVERIAGARTLVECAAGLSREVRREIGLTVRRFHDAGLDHVDLNCNNILIAPAGIYLIDFDKCSLHQNGGPNAWKTRNLARLQRSVQKEFPDWSAESRHQLWDDLISGYGS